MSVLIAGTVAIDNIRTPDGVMHDELLGGSATFAAIATSFSSPVNLVAVVGEDFPKEHLELFSERKINVDGLQVVEGGKTFRWTGEYHDDMNSRETLETHINVLDDFDPQLPAAAAESTIVVLANMAPADQLKVLSQCSGSTFVIADSMDLWINIAREELDEVLKRIDLLVINDSEAKMFMDTSNVIVAGKKLLEKGPQYVLIKKGEHGALLFGGGDRFFSAGAFPLEKLVDPTGAGDTFLGGLAGSLHQHHQENPDDTIGLDDISRAIIHGTVLASYNCESFSADKLLSLTQADIDARTKAFLTYTQLV